MVWKNIVPVPNSTIPDKTGIAQYGYKLLANNDATMFSKETAGKFQRIFENVEKTFANEIEETQ